MATSFSARRRRRRTRCACVRVVASVPGVEERTLRRTGVAGYDSSGGRSQGGPCCGGQDALARSPPRALVLPLIARGPPRALSGRLRRQLRRWRHSWPGRRWRGRPLWWQLHLRRCARRCRVGRLPRRPIEISTEQIPVRGAQHHAGHDTGIDQARDAEHADDQPCHRIEPTCFVHEQGSVAPRVWRRSQGTRPVPTAASEPGLSPSVRLDVLELAATVRARTSRCRCPSCWVRWCTRTSGRTPCPRHRSRWLWPYPRSHHRTGCSRTRRPPPAR